MTQGTDEARTYLLTGGLGEVIGLADVARDLGSPKVQMDTDMALALCELAASSSEAVFQSRVAPWMLACFGAAIAADVSERNHRFLEEALELVQATGCTAGEAHQLVDYVFGRPVGEADQEAGGVMLTLAALCLAKGLDMHAAAERELQRVWTKIDAIRAKQAAKPKHSPLPQEVTVRPKRVVLCGSSRFVDVMAVCAWLLERDEGVIAMGLHLLPVWYDAPDDHLAEAEGVAPKMDALHLCKIDLADEVFVVDRNDYIGASTASELRYAEKVGKTIRHYSSDPIGATVERLIGAWLAAREAGAPV